MSPLYSKRIIWPSGEIAGYRNHKGASWVNTTPAIEKTTSAKEITNFISNVRRTKGFLKLDYHTPEPADLLQKYARFGQKNHPATYRTPCSKCGRLYVRLCRRANGISTARFCDPSVVSSPSRQARQENAYSMQSDVHYRLLKKGLYSLAALN